MPDLSPAADHEEIIRRVIKDPKWAAEQDTRFWIAHVAALLDLLDAARAATPEPQEGGTE